ncbi:Universal stress protein [Methanosarcina barkeri 3]|uniref:Universal stress protein n=1 Tax=Methanosarcina barkeri 3 TaxID=1434107 RepID=A0A0E3SIV4_METBA|nr:Universal stress protein [Methanosarcina barkeri 3]
MPGSGGTVYAVYVISTEYFSSMAVDFVLHVELKTIQN